MPAKSLLLVLTTLLLAGILAGAPVPAAAQDDPAAPSSQEAAPENGEDEELKGFDVFDAWFEEWVVHYVDKVLFFQIGQEPKPDEAGNLIVRSMPLIVIVLFLGGFFFTMRYGFINLRLFRHSFDVIRGKFDDPEDQGEIPHFKALTSALSATVGLGNIAGVAVAITAGGPGAVFWMWFTAFFGMAMKFSSATFAQLYRKIHSDGRVLGGPMVYLEAGIKDNVPSLAFIAKPAAIFFAILAVISAFAGGNMFQSNQTASILALQFFPENDSPFIPLTIGIVLAILVGSVLIGGIRRIGDITSKLVPFMCIFYCVICLVIIAMNLGEVPSLFASIFKSAFRPDAVFGGFLGVLVTGMRRAAFSNEAGMGSASIAQAAAKTKEPIQAGIVAMLGPVIDTMIVCTMTALAILITKTHLTAGDLEGVEITAAAFGELGSAVPYVLCLAVFVFAYSTMISWGYYGERAIEYLFGRGAIPAYRVVYVLAVVAGPLLSLGSVIDFSDMVFLSMAFPNILGMAIMSGKVRGMIKDYNRRLKDGEIKVLTS